MRFMIRYRWLFAFLLLLITFQPADSQSKVQLTDLPNFDILREQFEKDTGKVRLITLLSPT